MKANVIRLEELAAMLVIVIVFLVYLAMSIAQSGG